MRLSAAINIIHQQNRTKLFCCTVLVLAASMLYGQSDQADTRRQTILDSVRVNALKRVRQFNAVTPVQTLDRSQLNQVNALTVADAAKYFPGVLIRDYGGAGGLKTISVRSLGAAHTGILYDGLPVSDLQTGQIDLSRFSTSFVKAIELYPAGVQDLTGSARASAAGTTLAIQTNSYQPSTTGKTEWQAGVKSGSFETIEAFAGFKTAVNKKWLVSANADGIYATGDYPFTIENGNQSSEARRKNALTRSLQAEANLVYIANDSSSWQTKIAGWTSQRGLPGAIVFFNDRSRQTITNRDLYAQTRYKGWLGKKTALVATGKYQFNHLNYRDPDFLNNTGGLDNAYDQQEYSGGFAIGYHLNKEFAIGIASDIAYTSLQANTANFSDPSRLGIWNSLTVHYRRGLLQANAALLHVHVNDNTAKNTIAANTQDHLAPTLAVNIKPFTNGPLNVRAFYKRLFRMPTFNDLYYTLVGNRSLLPEFANHYNVGAGFDQSFGKVLSRFSISADAYLLDISNKIVAIPNQNLFVWTMVNLGKVQVKGIDINTELNGSLFRGYSWFLKLAYTWQRAVDKTDPASSVYNNTIPYTPDHSGSGLLMLRYGRYSAGCNSIFSGKRYQLGENNPFNQVNGWITHDVFVTRQVPVRSINVDIRAELNNITDNRYDVIKFYPMPGRSYKISLIFNKS